MSISESAARGAGFGSLRFLVRGRGAVPEATLVDLRPRINEYPELFPLNPMFPQPGKRGGSRAPVSVGAPAVGALAEGPVVVPVVDFYPGPRPREGEVGTNNDPFIAVPQQQGIACYEDGASWRDSPSVGAGVTVTEVSGQLPRPFVITHVSYWAQVTTPTGANVSLGLKVAADNDTTGGFNTTGAPVVLTWPFGPVTPFDVVQHHYPNWVVRDAGQFIKATWLNASGAAAETYVIVDWKWLT